MEKIIQNKNFENIKQYKILPSSSSIPMDNNLQNNINTNINNNLEKDKNFNSIYYNMQNNNNDSQPKYSLEDLNKIFYDNIFQPTKLNEINFQEEIRVNSKKRTNQTHRKVKFSDNITIITEAPTVVTARKSLMDRSSNKNRSVVPSTKIRNIKIKEVLPITEKFKPKIITNDRLRASGASTKQAIVNQNNNIQQSNKFQSGKYERSEERRVGKECCR